MQPKPITQPRPVIYAGGESEAAKELIAAKCDAYVMHGDPPEKIGERITDMRRRRERLGLGPMIYGIAAYSIVRDTDADAKRELARITDVKGSAAGYKNYQQWLTKQDDIDFQALHSRFTELLSGNHWQLPPKLSILTSSFNFRI